MLARAAAAASAAANRGARGLATVNDQKVYCTFIFVKQQKRMTVPGMVGWSLLKTAQHHRLPLNGVEADEPWDYTTYGEGPMSTEDHVVVSKDYVDVVGPRHWEESELLRTHDAENYQEHSRLASCITLTKDMDGLTVLVPSTNADFTNYLW